jgi:glycerol kinase
VNVLAIDQGTSATKAILAGPGQEILGAAEVPVTTRASGDAVEADPEQLLESVLAAGRQALAAARAPADAVALANQGETVLAWDRRTGRPLTPAIVWQDRRSAGVCARLAPQAGWLAQVTGLPLDPYFAAPKRTSPATAWSPPPTAGCWPGSAPGTSPTRPRHRAPCCST